MASLITLTFVIALNAACVAPIKFVSDINSLSQPDTAGKKLYVILPGDKGIDPSELQFMEFASYVENAMAEKGYVKVESSEQAEIAVFLSYGIGDPQTHQYSYSVPVYGQTGVSSAQTFGTVSSFGGIGTYSGRTTYTPTYGVTGYRSGVNTITTYTRFLILAAYDIAGSTNDKNPVQLWKTEVSSTGSSNDLRFVFPYMVVAMKPYLATNTGRKIRKEVYEDDPNVLHLRGTLVPDKQ